MSDISLTSAMRANLLQLQTTERLIDRTQQRISTGKEINSALDGPAAFFAAKSLTDRANDLNSLKDSMGQAISTIKAADNAITAITDLVNQAKALANTARQNLGTDDAAVSSRASNATQFNELLNQINDLVTDASYAGKNLLLGDGAVYDATAASKENVDALTGLSATSVAGIGGGTSSSNIAVAVTGVVDETLASLSAVETAVGLTANTLSATSFTSTGDISVSVQSDATNTQWTSANADSTYSSTAANLASSATYTQYLTSEGSVTTAESTLGISSTSISQAQDTNAITLTVASDGVTTTLTADSSTTTDYNAAQTTADSTSSYDAEHYLALDADVTALLADGVTLDSVTNLDTDVVSLQFDAVTVDITSNNGGTSLGALNESVSAAASSAGGETGTVSFTTDTTSFVDGRTYTLSITDSEGATSTFSVTGDAGNAALDSFTEVTAALVTAANGGVHTLAVDAGGNGFSYTGDTAAGEVHDISFSLTASTTQLQVTANYADGTSDASTVGQDGSADYSSAYGTEEVLDADNADKAYTITQDSGGVATVTVDTAAATITNGDSNTVNLTQVRYSASGVDAGATVGTSNLDIGIVSFGDVGLAASQSVVTGDIVLEDNRQIAVTQGTNSYTRAVVPATGEGTLASGTQNFVLSNGATVNVDVDLNVLSAGSATLAAYTVTAAGTSNDLAVVFNEKNTSSVTISSTDASTEGLGVAASANSWGDAADIDQAITQLDSALASLRTVGQTLTSNLSVVQTREDFTTTFVNTLEEGADKWLLADSNKEGANLLILQTRQQLGTISLSIASQSAQSILRLFG